MARQTISSTFRKLGHVGAAIARAFQATTSRHIQTADKTREAAQGVAEKAKQAAQEAWASAKETAQRAKDTALGKAQESKESLEETAEMASRSMNTRNNPN
ncbi:hypothetical protein Ancab_000339 [Ancistrocladus abbreviatus]